MVVAFVAQTFHLHLQRVGRNLCLDVDNGKTVYNGKTQKNTEKHRK